MARKKRAGWAQTWYSRDMNDKAKLRRLESLLGYGLGDTAGGRRHTPVDNIIYTDVFTGKPTIDGLPDIKTELRFNGKTGGEYFNEIRIVGDTIRREVEVNAAWGAPQGLLDELKEAIAILESERLDADIANSQVSSKKVEDFSVSLRNAGEANDNWQELFKKYYSYYIRKPIIIDVNKEQTRDDRFF